MADSEALPKEDNIALFVHHRKKRTQEYSNFNLSRFRGESNFNFHDAIALLSHFDLVAVLGTFHGLPREGS